MILFILLAILVVVLYFYGTRNFGYWKKRGVKYENPIVFFGGNINNFLENISLSERLSNLYKSHPNERIVGLYEGNNPFVLIRDLDIIKEVLTTNFRCFHRRGINFFNNCNEPLMMNLFTVDDDVWKLLRQNLTAAFSSGKLKAMFPLIVERTGKLTEIAKELADTKEEVDVRELMARYTTDFIGACGFGIESQALNEENADFRNLGKRIFNRTIRDAFVAILMSVFPEIFKNIHFFAPEIEETTFSIVRQIMARRSYKPSGRNDFIDFLLELREKGKLVGESIVKRKSDGSPEIVEVELNDELLAAQAFIFFAAGFETSSAASSFLLHMLAFHPEVQEKCREEIDRVLERHDGKLCYDAVKDMKYLEMAFKESMRCLPSPGFLLRVTCDNFHIPGTDVVLEKGMRVVISTDGLCSDEKYFEDPEIFRPERFHPDNIISIQKFTYMPFGDGPRACIGERMGVMQSLAGVAAILRNFTVAPSRNSLRKPRIDPKSMIVQTILGGLPLALKQR
ncbi:cytochrome P450 6B5 [Bicyclus anynana]|uniref:unspecific monooxygenase n=1 Tax=Bicyclus anynana TaxID=110368 RepID=A0A6J1NGI2_BICAN|nr:cytochrome P450 6B5 [Bicyclus anynana]XP_023946055.1 cytochrome P450 6B5 [Bicyclus anynana]XP_023946056.1 cytochrome P450 6B5 [Bicyclus anynana]XP_052742911.1 cytochrome P450 6B5 [Bicyclus anynana]